MTNDQMCLEGNRHYAEWRQCVERGCVLFCLWLMTVFDSDDEYSLRKDNDHYTGKTDASVFVKLCYMMMYFH